MDDDAVHRQSFAEKREVLTLCRTFDITLKRCTDWRDNLHEAVALCEACTMSKNALLEAIIATLATDLALLTEAARSAHAAATHEECLPDNKYDTTGLEASYIAQGQANRAQEIRQALERYRKLTLQPFDNTTPIRLTAAVTIEDDDGRCRQVFIGPDAGGLKLSVGGAEYLVITPESPLGRALLGRTYGDEITVGRDKGRKTFTIVNAA